MLVTHVGYVPVIFLTSSASETISGQIQFSLSNSRGPILTDVVQNLDPSQSPQDRNAVIVVATQKKHTRMYHPYPASDSDDSANECSDPVAGCAHIFPDGVKELIMMHSRFSIEEGPSGLGEEYASNLTLTVTKLDVVVTGKPNGTPHLLLSFHQESLSESQEVGVSYILKGIGVALVSLGLHSVQEYIITTLRKQKQI